ncbi:hypothetical protein [Thalassomonas haliotis]|uniref:Uncharacterized protein n=1 Tax=Thalassomonas haliotis TaxID=485448 RepID=A0ABY7VJ29_9GAMM|nr:hypothetical protein [Thalassomonas haliotis]WDE13500.1 hypothetical protein H3N35_08720 [Thalassomonas haliotis]
MELIPELVCSQFSATRDLKKLDDNDILLDKLAALVRHKLKEQEQQPRGERLTIEQILNSAGIHGVIIGTQALAEIRACIYHSLGLGISVPGTLKKTLQGFIFDHDVFRPSEVRFYFPGDLEAEIYNNLTELGYALKTQVGEEEPVWRPKGMQRSTVAKKLADRARIGSKEYLAYLSYTPPRKDTITKH